MMLFGGCCYASGVLLFRGRVSPDNTIGSFADGLEGQVLAGALKQASQHLHETDGGFGGVLVVVTTRHVQSLKG